MGEAREHVERMSVMVQIRNMPDELHRTLKARAAMEGKSLSDYLLAELKRNAERPTLVDIRPGLAQLEPIDPAISPADILREERDRR